MFKRSLILLAVAIALHMAVAQTVPATDAAKHVGEHATVCGTIAGEHTAASSRGTPTFINLDRPYPHQVFTVLVWGEDRSSVGTLPASGQLCVTGTIKEYRDVPEVEIRTVNSWFVPK